MMLFDTSVLIDARDASSPWHQWAKDQLAEAVSGEGACANTVVVSEVSVRATDPEKVPKLLEQMGITLVPLPLSAAVPAAKAFALYLDRLKGEGKKTESKVPLPDFLIGAHAQAEGLKLTTRDPKRIGTYFPKVLLVTPSESQPSH
jgi:predicted nucleic acid-binding protein